MLTDKTIQLHDGRTLAYTEHGDLSGKPIFFIHGNPGSRLTRHPDETIAQRLKARIIMPCNSEGGFTFQSLTCCSID